ncbi:hypothetical protein K435DRAFT_789709 [Dendrothele bispora CBS 962.96]|uniref:Uncharacterized protein n=1 Tax=Dendrothele bispora (strain CBS 962.96) TaxID=1314807 RepID=A0A4S8MS45_DENBC|nr:hypothetical protein K435DRAFT_789709 [Dendrothele bispora CBS 962.96]
MAGTRRLTTASPRKPPENDPDTQSKEKVSLKPPANVLGGRADDREEPDRVEKKTPYKYKIPQKKFDGVELEPTVNGRRVPAAPFQGVKDVTRVKEKEGKTVRFEPSSWNTNRYKTGGNDENFSPMNKWSKSYTPAYHTKAEIEDEAIVDKMVEKILSAEVGTTVNDLMAVSKSVREGVRRKLTMRRVPTAQHNLLSRVFDFVEEATMVVASEELVGDSGEEVGAPVPEVTPILPEESKDVSVKENDVSEEYPTSDESIENAEESGVEDVLAVNELAAIEIPWSECSGPLVPQESAQVYFQSSDPVLQYLETLKDGEKPRRVVVARESESLRTVYPVVGGRGRVECLHDSGSQVVSTSKARAMELGLS